MLFENNDNYLDMLFNFNDMSKYQMSQSKSDDLLEGFLKGNMFENEYVPYKNLTYIKPKLKNEREKMQFELMKYAFAINDYNLFLDLHPDNQDILNKYKLSTKKLEELCKEYEKKYGPLTIMNSDFSTFKWIDSPWPWDKEDGLYV